jgi:chromate reductase
MAKFKLGIVVGSNRRESINRKLAQALAKLGSADFEAKFLQIDDLPLYNQDQENELPASVRRFKAEAAACDALLFVTPEHNRSVPALLKNAIDWGSRPYGTSVWTGKPAATAGASGGGISSAIAQTHLRQILGNFVGMHIMGGEAYVAFKPDLIDAAGNVSDESTRKFLKGFVDNFAAFAGRFAAQRTAAAA